MSRRSTTTDEVQRTLSSVISKLWDDGVPLDRRMEHLQVIREADPGAGRKLDQCLLSELARLQTAVKAAQASQEELRRIHEKLTTEPWHQAVVRDVIGTGPQPRVMVAHRHDRLVVGVADEVDLESLRRGDVVFLGPQLNVIMAKSPSGLCACGEVAMFERRMSDGRLVLSHHGQRVVVEVGDALDAAALQPNEMVRWNRDCALALEKIADSAETSFMLQELPRLGRGQVGGQEDNLNRLISALTVTLIASDKADLYQLSGRQSILMVGPPGCGKTHMARVVTSEVARRSGQRCRFAVVKPGEFESPYVGETQQRIRGCFAGLRRAAREGMVVVFLDEIESIGRIRGGLVGHHSDKFLAALLAELDGFESRSDVAVIAATNRKDLVDPALLERISGVEIAVNRPSMQAAREIFEIHLPESVPYHHNGSAAGRARDALIDLAVSRLYSPNSDGQQLCTIRFRDGKSRIINARELMSGRCIEQICRAVRQAALWRDVGGGDAGLCDGDVESAVDETLDRLRTTLSRTNVHAYLADLPQDVEVISVEPIVRRVLQPHRYLNAV